MLELSVAILPLNYVDLAVNNVLKIAATKSKSLYKTQVLFSIVHMLPPGLKRT